MKVPRLVSYLLVAMLASAASGLGQPDTGRASRKQQQNIDLLLLRETHALDRYDEEVAPGIHCNYYRADVRQSCKDILAKISDDAENARRAIVQYRTSVSRQAVVLFDAYVDLTDLLHGIETLSIIDDLNGAPNRNSIATGYNSFVKLTDAWFTGELRETLRDTNQ